MLYFAYGSNLNHHQMINIRCIGSKYLKSTFLKDYKLTFCHPNILNKYGYENIVKKIEHAIEQHPSFLKVLSEKELLEIEESNKNREW